MAHHDSPSGRYLLPLQQLTNQRDQIVEQANNAILSLSSKIEVLEKMLNPEEKPEENLQIETDITVEE